MNNMEQLLVASYILAMACLVYVILDDLWDDR
jgi:hypothetical protein